MIVSVIDNFEAMIAGGHDSAMLRFGLGSEYLRSGDAKKAIEHLSVAVDLDADYSAGWKLLAKAQMEAGRKPEAAESYRRGIAAAERRGDRQAAKEMQVFLRRLQQTD